MMYITELGGWKSSDADTSWEHGSPPLTCSKRCEPPFHGLSSLDFEPETTVFSVTSLLPFVPVSKFPDKESNNKGEQQKRNGRQGCSPEPIPLSFRA